MAADDGESVTRGQRASRDSLTATAGSTDASATAPCGEPGSSPASHTPTPPARSLSLDTTLPRPGAPRRASQQHAKRAELAPPVDLATLVRPAASSSAGEYSPLEAPRLPFSSRRTSTSSAFSGSYSPWNSHSRASSSSSLGEAARPARSELAARSTDLSPGQSGPAASARTAVAGNGEMMRAYGGADANGSAQEELLDEPERGRGYADNPYAWERPLDAVNRHSRLLDAAPVAAPVLDNSRRLSRLPPGFSMLDPFGFNLTNDASPYDLALSASQADLAAGITSAARSSVRASYLGSPAVSTTPSLSPYPSTSSTSSLPSTPSLSSPPDGSFAPGAQPWLKPRASSAGEQGMGHNRSHVRNGLLAPNGYASPRQANGRSKLSGEIDADAMSVASTSKRQPQSEIPGVPTDADYLNSKLYQRTLKAQKALEKERAKAAAKGKVSRYDSSGPASKSTSSLSSTLGGFGGLGGMRRRSGESTRPPSIMSAAGVSGTASPRRGGRKGLGWFRSSSEAALGLGESTSSPEGDIEGTIPASKSSSQISMQAGRYGRGGSSPRLGVSANGFTPTPTMPPSPNLPSEATLRAMGVSTDQLRAAAQAPQSAQRPKSGSRQNSAEKRSPTGSALGTPTGPPSPGLEQTRPARPPPSRSATLEPPPATPPPSITPPPTASTASANGHAPHPPPISTLPPRVASRTALPANVPLPASASPTRAAFAAPAPTEQPHAPLQLENSPIDSAPPGSLPPSIPLPQPPALQQPASSARAAPPPASASAPAPVRSQPPPTPAVATAAGSLAPPPVQVKRRRSGFGLLFGGFGGGSASSSQRNSAQSDLSSAPSARQERETEKAGERERMMKKMGDRQQEQEQRWKAALGSSTSSKIGDTKLVKERPGGGGSGFFSRKPRLSNAQAPSAVIAPPPPKGAMAPRPVRPKKDEAAFFHPSQTLYASRDSSSPSQPASPQLVQQAIRAVNPSPRVLQQATAPPSANSSDSSATFASLGSSASTLPPRGQTAFPSVGEASLPQKKGAFASLFSSHGSIRGRTKSSPTAPPPSSLGSKVQSNGYPPADKVLPVLPSPTANGGVLKKPPRGQSLGAAGQQQANGQSNILAHQQPYATYAT